MIKSLKNAYWNAIAWASVGALSIGNAIAADVDPAAPLDAIKTARTKAQNSTLNIDSAQTGGTRVIQFVMIAAGVIGLIFCANSVIKLYQAGQNENSRESAGRSILGVGIAVVLSIVSITLGAGINYIVGNN